MELFLPHVVQWLAFINDMGSNDLDRPVPNDLESMRYIAEIHERCTGGNRDCRFPRYLDHATLYNIPRLDPMMEMRGQYISRLEFAKRQYDFHAGRTREVYTTQFFRAALSCAQPGAAAAIITTSAAKGSVCCFDFMVPSFRVGG